MKPYREFGDSKIYLGHNIDVLKSLPSGIADMCVTSPAYWGM